MKKTTIGYILDSSARKCTDSARCTSQQEQNEQSEQADDLSSLITVVKASDTAYNLFKSFGESKSYSIFTREGWEEISKTLFSRVNTNVLPEGSFEKITCEYTESETDGEKVYSFSASDSYDKIILYLHGGAYVFPIDSFNVIAADMLTNETNSKVVLPLYPLAPESTYKETYVFLTDLYHNLLNERKPIVIMGDSAGGGLALAFTQYLKETAQILPVKLVLFSPWTDIALTNKDIPKYEQKDVLLRAEGLREAGKLWAGGTDLKDCRISPIHGDFSGMPPTLIFTGTDEILYPDTCKVLGEMHEKGVSVHMIAGQGLGHAYPLFLLESIPHERREIILPALEFINGS